MLKKFWNVFSGVIWVTFFVTLTLTFYVNYSMPHGQYYSTGEFTCQNNGKGPCGESYKEDMRELNIPDWAKFLREHFELMLIFLGIAGFYSSMKKDE